MAKELDKEEMKKRLKDANVYEENMSDDLMAEFYEAIKNSETSLQEESQKDFDVLDEAEKSLNESANELLEAINNSESVAPSERKHCVSKSDDDDSLDAFSQDIMQKSKSKLSQDETNNNNNSIHIGNDGKAEENENIVDMALDTPIGFNDMPKSQKNDKNMLKIISHELKYINIQNSKKFLTANSETRIKMLHNYHFAAVKQLAHYASLSTNMVPAPKPITGIDHDICVNPVISTLQDEESQLLNETYVSRSGRHTKRKMYNEFDDSSLDAFNGSPKRTKTTKEKAPKPTAKKREEATQEEVISSNNNDRPERVTLKDWIDGVVEAKEAPPKPPKRTYQRKNLSIDEIMRQSPPFKDLVPLKKGRTGAILNAAKEETEKQNKQEAEIAKFTSSLDVDSQSLEDDDDSEKIIIDVDEVVERRRVIPTLPMSRKPIHGKKRGGGAGPEPLNISTSAKRPNMLPVMEEAQSPVTNGVARRNAVPKRSTNNNNNTDRNEPSTSSTTRTKKDVNMTPCPLCSMSFPQKEIEEHAATCGEDVFPQTPQPQRITCEVCDTVVPFTTDYEVHVKDCTAKRNAGGLA